MRSSHLVGGGLTLAQVLKLRQKEVAVIAYRIVAAMYASTTKDPLCRAAMSESSKTYFRWCGVIVRRGDASSQMSSSSLDHGSKLRGPSPKALV
ncbi:hypothetical protein TNCV_3242461 [Trichonephila clavipes]|nr:hypothetical protein TNCV_3242461 [Trichonephila clavipes]